MASPPPLDQPTVEHLIDEYSDWKSVLERDPDNYEAISKLVTLYKFAIANYANPLSELLLDAIATMEAGVDQ